jgi:hypothetical protein
LGVNDKIELKKILINNQTNSDEIIKGLKNERRDSSKGKYTSKRHIRGKYIHVWQEPMPLPVMNTHQNAGKCSDSMITIILILASHILMYRMN